VTVTLIKFKVFKVGKLKVKSVFLQSVSKNVFYVSFSFLCIVMSKDVFYVLFCFSVSIEFYAELFIVMFKESCLVLSIGDGNFINFIAPC
jgi:hypothetical protein